MTVSPPEQQVEPVAADGPQAETPATEVNLGGTVRFILYAVAIVSVIVTKYTVAKDWAGVPEQDLVNDLSDFLLVLAAANTPVARKVYKRLARPLTRR